MLTMRPGAARQTLPAFARVRQERRIGADVEVQRQALRGPRPIGGASRQPAIAGRRVDQLLRDPGVPLQVHGTTANPQFVPDVGGAAANMLKSEHTCAGGTGNVGGLATGLAGAAGGGNAAGAVNQLGGLLGGKKKKP